MVSRWHTLKCLKTEFRPRFAAWYKLIQVEVLQSVSEVLKKVCLISSWDFETILFNDSIAFSVPFKVKFFVAFNPSFNSYSTHSITRWTFSLFALFYRLFIYHFQESPLIPFTTLSQFNLHFFFITLWLLLSTSTATTFSVYYKEFHCQLKRFYSNPEPRITRNSEP